MPLYCLQHASSHFFTAFALMHLQPSQSSRASVVAPPASSRVSFKKTHPKLSTSALSTATGEPAPSTRRPSATSQRQAISPPGKRSAASTPKTSPATARSVGSTPRTSSAMKRKGEVTASSPDAIDVLTFDVLQNKADAYRRAADEATSAIEGTSSLAADLWGAVTKHYGDAGKTLADTLFDAWDVNGDGTRPTPAFISVYMAPSSEPLLTSLAHPSPRRCKLAGSLSKHEFRKAVRDVLAADNGAKYDVREVDALFSELDVDKGGDVDIGELSRGMRRLQKQNAATAEQRKASLAERQRALEAVALCDATIEAIEAYWTAKEQLDTMRKAREAIRVDTDARTSSEKLAGGQNEAELKKQVTICHPVARACVSDCVSCARACVCVCACLAACVRTRPLPSLCSPPVTSLHAVVDRWRRRW